MTEPTVDPGFIGVRVDPTPLENYTLAGVISGATTPENDAQQRLDALNAAREAHQPPD